MSHEMMKQDVAKYKQEVKNYVNGVLVASLSAGIDLDVARERENLELLSKLLVDEELREKIAEKIVDDGIRFSMSSYKDNLSEQDRKVVFMRKIYSFLSMQQIASLAKHFDKQITAEQSQKHSR